MQYNLHIEYIVLENEKCILHNFHEFMTVLLPCIDLASQPESLDVSLSMLFHETFHYIDRDRKDNGAILLRRDGT